MGNSFSQLGFRKRAYNSSSILLPLAQKSKRESAGTEAAPESVDGSPVNERCLFARVSEELD
jgi:hypothetical protein